jgi:putative ABC transport system permease protein
MVPLARRNLLSEKGRLVMSVAGVAFAVLLVLIILSLYRGWSGVSALFSELPGELWVSQAGTSDPFRSTSLLPAGREAELRRITGVQAVMPVYARRVSVGHSGSRFSVFFMAIGAPSGLPLSEDRRKLFFPPRKAVTIDSTLAHDARLGVGDTLTILGHPLRVAAVRPGGNPIFELAFLNASDAPELLGTLAFVSFYLIAAAPGAGLESVAAAVPDAIPGAETHTTGQYAAAMNEVVNQGFLPVVVALVAIGLVIGGAVVALTTYTATIEKARDFGVLKALGASGGFLYRVVLKQSLIVGVLGSVLGLGASALAANLIKRGVPEFVTDLRAEDALVIFLAALVVSVVAAWVPVRRIDRIDPAIVFRA